LVKKQVLPLPVFVYNSYYDTYTGGDMLAEQTLNKVKQYCLTNSGDEQIWTNKGTKYFWNRGKDTYSGTINGVVRKLAGMDAQHGSIWVVAGSVKIDAEGTILRFTGLPRKLQKTFEPVNKEMELV
jgi:hypothetical protein